MLKKKRKKQEIQNVYVIIKMRILNNEVNSRIRSKTCKYKEI